jgi:hypothetical protein
MAEDFSIKGAEDFDALARSIRKHADAKALRKELSAGLGSATKPVREDMRSASIAALPARGGLRARMEKRVGKGRTTTRSGQTAAVRIDFSKKGSKGYDPRTLRGRIRHPLFGNKGFWFETRARTDVIDAEFEKSRPGLQRAVMGVIEEIGRKVTRGAR